MPCPTWCARCVLVVPCSERMPVLFSQLKDLLTKGATLQQRRMDGILIWWSKTISPGVTPGHSIAHLCRFGWKCMSKCKKGTEGMTFWTCNCGLGREKRCISGERRGRDAMTCCVKGYNLVFPMSCVILESSCIQKQMKVKWNMCYNFASVHWQEMMWMYLLHWRCQHRDCRHGNRDFSTSSKSPHHFCHPIPPPPHTPLISF